MSTLHTVRIARGALQPRRGPLAASMLSAMMLTAIMLAMPDGSLAAALAQDKAAAPEQALKTRVEQFYTLLRTRQVSKAQTYATKESRDRLADEPQNPFLAFKVGAVRVEPDGKTGQVSVELTVMAPSMGTPMPFERKTEWTLEDGEWRIKVPARPPEMSIESMMGMTGDAEVAKPEELKFKGYTYGFGVLKPGEKTTATFPFTNIAKHDVTISEIKTGCDCLAAKIQKKTYKPGESGELAIEFDSTNYEYVYAQSIVVLTIPGDIKTILEVHGEVVPRNIASPQKPATGQ